MLSTEEDRRQSRRFRMQEGAFAFIDNTPFTIQDISEGGMMLQSVVFDEMPAEHLLLDIFLKSEKFYLENVPVRLIRQLKNKAKTPFSTIQVRRYGLAFEDMDEQQRKLLDSLIFSNTVGEA